MSTVPKLLTRLEDLLLTEQKEEKKWDGTTELSNLLQMVNDYSINKYRRRELIQHKALDLFVPALLQHHSDANLITVLKILSHLATNSDATRRQIHAAGGVTLAADHVGNPSTAPSAWKFLGHLALSRECAITIIQDTQQAMVTALLASSSSSSSSRDQEVPIIREVMATVSNLAGHVDCHLALQEMILEPLCTAMQRHVDNAGIQMYACQVWWNILANVDPRRKKKDPVPGVMKVWYDNDVLACLTKTIQTHADRSGVQEAACGALSVVAWKPKEDDAARGATVPFVWSTMKRFPDQVAVLTQSCRALANLCRECTVAQSVIVDTDLVLLHKASLLSVEQSKAELATAVLDIHASLALSSKAACTKLVDAHAVEDTAKCLRTFVDPMVADAACLVLWAVAHHYGKYVSEVCRPDVESALETHGEEQIRYGARLVKRLNWKERFGRR